jgi:hypothetical protein
MGRGSIRKASDGKPSKEYYGGNRNVRTRGLRINTKRGNFLMCGKEEGRSHRLKCGQQNIWNEEMLDKRGKSDAEGGIRAKSGYKNKENR